MSEEREQLITDLRRIKENEYKLQDNEKVSDYLGLMLKYVGDADPELRDKLIYSTFAAWIEDLGYFTDEELKELLSIILSEDFAFYKIGSCGDDSVLRRSFSVLLVNPIVCRHMENEFLHSDTLTKITKLLIKYIHEEKDLRGYDKEKGWVDSIAHASDGLLVAMNCNLDNLSEGICKELLQVIENKYIYGGVPLYSDEDERIVSVLYANIVTEDVLSREYVCSWLKGLTKFKELKDRRLKFIARVNIKNLVRSLYFRMLLDENIEEVSKTLLEVEKKINIYL